MLFSFQSKEWKRPVRLFSLCPFVSILSTLQDGWCWGEGVLPFPAGNKSLEGKFAGVQHFSSPLLTKPSWCFSLHNLFQQMLGAVDERQSLARTPGPHGRGAGQRVEPTLSSQGLTIVNFSPVSVCSSAAAPSQPITGGRALSSISGMNALPQPVLKLMLRMESGSTMPSPE